MNNLNMVLIGGNLVKEPVTKKVGETKVCRLVIGINESVGKGEDKKEESTYPVVEVWGGIAESCEKYLEKGRSVRVQGKLRQKSWEDESGKHTMIYVLGEHVEFGPKKTNDTSEKAKATAPAGSASPAVESGENVDLGF